jgi:hypothetical protein
MAKLVCMGMMITKKLKLDKMKEMFPAVQFRFLYPKYSILKFYLLICKGSLQLSQEMITVQYSH